MPSKRFDSSVTISGLSGKQGHTGEQQCIIQRVSALGRLHKLQRLPVFALRFSKLTFFTIGPSQGLVEGHQFVHPEWATLTGC